MYVGVEAIKGTSYDKVSATPLVCLDSLYSGFSMDSRVGAGLSNLLNSVDVGYEDIYHSTHWCVTQSGVLYLLGIKPPIKGVDILSVVHGRGKAAVEDVFWLVHATSIFWGVLTDQDREFLRGEL